MSVIRVCDWEDKVTGETCSRVANVTLTVIGEGSEWKGMTVDLCDDHDGLGPLMDQWDAGLKEVPA